VSSSRTEPAGAVALVDVTMPQMGVSVAEGTIVAWRVEPGDRIQSDQTVCEISTDKIDSEVPSPITGIVAELLVGIDETVPVGTVLARIAPEGASPQATQVDSPKDREPAAGTSLEASASEPAGAGAARRAPGANGPGAPRGAANGRHYSPVVQRIAAAHGIDLDTVVGTGRGGRVRKQDVMALVGAGAVGAPAEGDHAAAEEPPLHIESPYRPDPEVPLARSGAAQADVRPPAGRAPSPPVASSGLGPAGALAGDGQLSRMRRSIGEHMKRSLDTAATCTTWIEVDMTGVQAARRSLGVTALAFVARACVGALREHPALNAWLEGERYTRFDREVHLGIAVSLGEDGLIVPVIHGAHELSEEGLGARIRDLATRARSGTLSPDEVRGATFTITNPGQYGSVMATPIINQPQVAILDLEAIVKRPVVVTDEHGQDSIAIRSMTILGLSWDHRALDGALSAQFLSAVKRRLEAVRAG
jgi:pyruvate/2-oxoglutarate dehydrogenase complex dihydrolipoamide acyltransferase (E2) component